MLNVESTGDDHNYSAGVELYVYIYEYVNVIPFSSL